jgi:hypothetical protein
VAGHAVLGVDAHAAMHCEPPMALVAGIDGDDLALSDQGHAAAMRAVRRWPKPAIDVPSRVILSSLPYQLYDLDPQADAQRRTALISALAS